MKVVAPWRGEFGHRCFWHAPAVHAIEESKVVYIEPGMEALYPSADEWETVPERDDETRARNDYSRDPDRDDFTAMLARRHPDGEVLYPTQRWPRERFVPRPVEEYGIECDVVVAPRYRDYGHNKNWSLWPAIVHRLEAEGLRVFAGGARDTSYPVSCEAAWDHPRTLDATLEAMHAARLVVATDAGLAHLAILAGCPLLMVTHANGTVAPGPNTSEHGEVTEHGFWPVRIERYHDNNHTGSAIDVLHDAWYNPDVTVNAALERLQ